MAGWRVARALETLRGQVNALAPGRSKTSDGSIGDAAHAATKSDHNPDADGVVKAIDISHDVAGGCNANLIWDSLRAARDPRVQYVIWNRQIVNADQVGASPPWTVRSYNGANPHDHHIHISTRADSRRYDDTSPWAVQVAPAPAITPAPKPAPIDAAKDDLTNGVALAAGVSFATAAWAVFGWIGVATVVAAAAAFYILRARRRAKRGTS